MMPGSSRASIRVPSIPHIWIPARDGRSAAIGLSMYSPCRPAIVAGQRLLWAATRLGGSRVLPGRRTEWADPVDGDVWSRMSADWRSEFGAWDSVALYKRPQVGRNGCALILIRDGRSIGFVRITTSADRARREFEVMDAVHSASPRTFEIARPVAWGSDAGWAWLATETVPAYPLSAVRWEDDRAPVIHEIGSILDSTLPRAAGIPGHWVGAHGDLAPWNLRFERRRVVRVIDWEDAAFAPPGADALYAAVTASITFSDPVACDADEEAIAWTRAAVVARMSSTETAESVNNRLLRELDVLAGR